MTVVDGTGLNLLSQYVVRVQKSPEYFVNGRQRTTFGQEQLRQLVQKELARGYP